MIFRDRIKYPYYQNYWYEVVAVKAGQIALDLSRMDTLISVLLFGSK